MRDCASSISVGVLLATLLLPAVAEAESKTFIEAYNAAFAAFDAHEYDTALAGFEKAYAIEPNPSALYNIARCQHLLRRLEDAAETYERFLKIIAPDHELRADATGYAIDAVRLIGEKKLAGRDFTAARTQFERGLKIRSGEPSLLAGLGDALAGLGKKDDARRTHKRALVGTKDLDLKARIEASLKALEKPEKPEGASVPPPARKKSPALAIGLGAGAGAVVVATVVTILAVALRPHAGAQAIDGYPGQVLDIRGAR